MRLALVIVWTGPWKPWINLYIESCRHNPGWDFLIFTDQEPPAAAAPNVRFFPMTLALMEKRIHNCLGLAASLPRAYKLCDYKPAYGQLFADELRGYTHWGYCDEDLIWGRLDRFILPDVLDAHDIVTSCRCCIVGQLTLLRNDQSANTLFRRVPGWREILQEPGTMNLAETILDHQARAEEARGELRVWRRQIQLADNTDENWDAWADRLELAEHGRHHPHLPAGPALWRDGALFDANRRHEYAFFHFKIWKNTWALPPVPPVPAGVAEWQIGPAGIQFVPTPDASPEALAFVRSHNAASTSLRRRQTQTRLTRRLLAPWSRLQHAVKRRITR